ncbi:MAG TPA: hypothetical protein VJY85_10685, partial [Candidatus Limnocylindria bacterium]|nr:hypothetical protein [Candidatus Limnocylindria bacterium]
FIHFFDEPKLDEDGNEIFYEDITTTCNATHSNAPCKSVTTANGNTFATIWFLENGKTFGH